MDYYACMTSPLGLLLMRSDGIALTGLYFVGQKDCPDVDGFAPMRPERFDPKAGLHQGKSIRTLKAVRQEQHSTDLFATEGSLLGGFMAACADPMPPGPAPSALQRAPVHGMPPEAKAGAEAASASPTPMQWDTPAAATALFEQTWAEMREYFQGKRQVFGMLLRPQGTVFQQKVWQTLLQIPYGQVVSYGEIARKAGLSGGHGRAVGTAVGRNPLTIIIPCHRVVSGSGTLTGYSGGLDRKLALLQLEGFSLS